LGNTFLRGFEKRKKAIDSLLRIGYTIPD